MTVINYASIRDFDISNGEGVGVSLFVQGCHFHCPDCFNTSTHDFNGGKAWTNIIRNDFIQLINRPYIKRVTILGGEPLAVENVPDVLDLVKQIRTMFGNKKTIWIYSGYAWEECQLSSSKKLIDVEKTIPNLNDILKKRIEILSLCDVMVDGRFDKNKKDLSLKFRGSSNQRIIDIKKSLENNKIELLENIN